MTDDASAKSPGPAEAKLQRLRIGTRLPLLEKEPISRLTLALYCGASGDHNPIHVDSDFAKAAGQRDVFAHGMLAMAYLGHLLTGWTPQSALREYSVRFMAIMHVGARLRCEGEVVDLFSQLGERRARIALSAHDQEGRLTLSGEAVVALEQV